ncbi:hypothetical protein RUM43_003350 [Polyplax serrata]|uniref:Cadherin domain-containing protein n=1 Tax=Polyplax serrata TaxID=468196 RepID=A0AAN8PEE5_POLSC
MHHNCLTAHDHHLTCTVKSKNKKRTIPVIVRVSDVNDNAPHFLKTPYETTVSESSECPRERKLDGKLRPKVTCPPPEPSGSFGA